MKTNYTLKNLLLVSFFLFSVMYGNAQGFYINLGGAYNLAAGGQQVIDYNVNETYTGFSSNTSGTQENVIGSFGKGITYGAAVGYMCTPNVEAEVGFTVLSGASYSTSYSYVDSYDPFNPYSVKLNETTDGKTMRITPSLRLTAGEKIKPYVKAGLVIGISTEIDYTMSGTITGSYTGNGSISETDKYTGGTSLGFQGAMGVNFILSSSTSVYLEGNFISQNWAPTQNAWTLSETGNGSESGTTTYVDKVTLPSARSSNFNRSLQSNKHFYPFGSAGFGLGFQFAFGAKPPAPPKQ
jgi:hypothetical protein